MGGLTDCAGHLRAVLDAANRAGPATCSVCRRTVMRCQSDVMPGRSYCNQFCRDLGRVIFDGSKPVAVNVAVK
jgi:hypothetical protein